MPEELHNRLGDTLSPYLLGHAHNPVAWQPWDEQAFEAARRLDRPIFLSIGYATCHWCHVMERESFEDSEVARVMNDTFVCIKVDREERPDVDAVYMEAAQVTTGRGGWPLTAILTPDARPFYVATYLPPRARYGRPGVVELSEAVAEAWQERREALLNSAAQLTDALQSQARRGRGEAAELDESTLHRAFAQLRQRFDGEHGGWGDAPKFPTPHVGRFLLRYAARTGVSEAQRMVATTLDAMRNGGIFDHLGGGFHRYSTDATWTLPHFEKMLYDQAGLLLLYAEGFAATRGARYAHTARDIVEYLTRDLRDDNGAFYAAEDADSEGREGAFYVWTRAELDAALGKKEAAVFAELYNVLPEGNFEEEATRDKTGENVLFLTSSVRDAAPEGTDPERFSQEIARMRQRLFEARKKRPRPLLDDKILTDWNGLVVASLARAGVLLEVPQYIALAQRAMDYLLETLRAPGGRLLHRARHGHAGLNALADDYAFVIDALIELHQATQQPAWLFTALQLQQDFNDRFFDEDVGAYQLQPVDGEKLISQTIAFYDGATPSANSVAAHNLLRLARLTGDTSHADRARRIFAAAAHHVEMMPSGFAALLLALDEDVNAPPDVVLAAAADAEVQLFIDVFNRQAAPGSLLVVLDAGRVEALRKVAAPLAAYPVPEKGVQAYVCQNLVCEAPVDSVAALAALL